MNLRRISAALKSILIKKYAKKFDGFFYLFAAQDVGLGHGEPETFFLASDGRKVPIYRHYRYSVKTGWRYYRNLSVMAELDHQGVLTESESEFLKNAVGTRTLSVDLHVADERLSEILVRVPNLFIESTLENIEGPIFKPSNHLLNKQVDNFARKHFDMFDNVRNFTNCEIKEGASILEIGFISGGLSIFGFERLGFKPAGLDNCYGGLVENFMALPDYNKRILGSGVDFCLGDITKTTSFSEGSFDIVFSSSVLEHIQNLPLAFKEMYRLLKPGGLLIHSYHPYFCHDGGHALGIGDSPWAHVLLSQDDYIRYMNEIRPSEACVAVDWLSHALHRDTPQWKMQKLVINSGFDIRLWRAKPSAKRWLKDLTPELVQGCFLQNPEICLGDLVSHEVFFVARKN